MAEEKQVKGQPFLQQLGRRLMGEPQNPPNDPKNQADHYKEKTEALEAQDSYLQTKDRIENPPSAREAQAKRETDLETRASAAEQRARDAEDKLRSASEDARKEAETAAAQAHDEAEQAKKELHDHQITMLSTKLDEVLKSRKPLQDQMNEYFAFADQMAAKLGWVKPGAVTPASENPQISLEIARLNIEDARAAREHERQLAQDKRDWDLKIMELNDKRDIEKTKLEQDARKTEMLFSAPQAIGAAIAQGLMDHGKGETRSIQQAPKTYTVQVNEREAGEFYCPDCEAGVGIGTTSTTASCIKCGAQFRIDRIPATGPEPKEK